MKKYVALLLAIVMVFGLTACAGGGEGTTAAPTEAATTAAPTEAATTAAPTEAAPTEAPTEAPTPSGDGNLVGVAMPTKDL